MKKKKTISKVMLQMILGGFVFIQLFPLYWLLTFSLKNNLEIFGGNIMGLPEHFRIENYVYALRNGDIMLYLFNSAFVTTVTVVCSCFFGAMAAYAIVRMRWKLAKTVLNFFLLGTMIPLHAVLLPLFLTLNKAGILNSYWALIIPYTAFALPMAIFIFTGFLETIPKEMEEAACMDGCGIYQTFLVIIMPLLKPALATVSIFTFLSTWNELMFATTFITDRKFKTMTVGIMSFVSQYRTEWGPIGASLVIAVIPTIVIYVLMSKQIQESFRAGGLKG
jgi:raffinose/stachyose/melibiose transport system permease protein